MYKYIDENTVEVSPDVISFAIANYENNSETKAIAQVLGFSDMETDEIPTDGGYVPTYELEETTETVTIHKTVIHRHWKKVSDNG